MTAVRPATPGVPGGWRLPDRVDAEWSRLVQEASPSGAFEPSVLANQPEPLQRWLRHAIVPGTPLRACVELSQHGRIKMLGWRSFTAVQVLAAFQGYIWAERTALFILPIHGFDRLIAGDGEMRHYLLRRVPVVVASGPDFIRSAVARLCCEIAFVPAAALDPAVSWRAVDDNSVTGRITYLDRSYDVTLTVAASGALERVTVPRWTKLGGGPYQEHPFTAEFSGERTVDGYTIPLQTRAGYRYGTPNWPRSAFIVQVIDRASYH